MVFWDYGSMEPQTRRTIDAVTKLILGTVAAGALAALAFGGSGRGCSVGCSDNDRKDSYGARYGIGYIGDCEVIEHYSPNGKLLAVYQIPDDPNARHLDPSYRRFQAFVAKAEPDAVVTVTDLKDRRCRLLAQPSTKPFKP
ncbi:hypothetical protein J4216_03260 [Candidatus Woesearchaeota archaeon]|nr:hypothetical protein [Candidatus Woesearchaeota archaeon]